jgi:hypothetical protein
MSLNCGLYRAYCSSPDDYESEELQWNDIIRVEPKDSKKNLSQYHSVQILQMTRASAVRGW